MTDYQFSAEWCRAAAGCIAELEQRLAAAEACIKQLVEKCLEGSVRNGGLMADAADLTTRLSAAEEAMKAAASLPGEMWLTGQLALAEFLSGEDGEHLKYALEQYEQHDAAKVSGKKIADHEFQPSVNYPPGDGCSHIVCGHDWTIADPVRCRKPEAEHERSARDEAAKGGRDE